MRWILRGAITLLGLQLTVQQMRETGVTSLAIIAATVLASFLFTKWMGRLLGVDVGTVRIGVASSDPDGILATPVETVRRDRSGRHVRRLAELAAELEVVEVVVGLPRTLADRTGSSAQDAIELAGQLEQTLTPANSNPRHHAQS